MFSHRTDLPAEPRGKRRARRHAWLRLLGRSRRPRPGVHDRGTVLLMVLGVLALMAIIAVVYAAIGKADRSTSAAMVRVQRVEEQVDQLAKYMADVIGKDVFATYAQEDLRSNQAQNPTGSTVRLEAYDAAYTDPMMRSQGDPSLSRWNDGRYRFNAWGSYTDSWRVLRGTNQLPDSRDPRRPSDPFIAATEPTLVNGPKVFSRTPVPSPYGSWLLYPPDQAYLNNRDWSQISNLAPSGNFVNLWALRNNFRAVPGFSRNQDPKPGTSDLLTLIDPETGDSYRSPGLQGDPNATLTGMRVGDLSRQRAENRPRYAILNRPWDWTCNQLGAFRSTTESGSPYGVDDREYMPYQWADADGDGFYDARWFELADISDPNNPRSLIASNGRLRLFVAARVMDLSALVNVNTASDFQFEPKRYYQFPKGSDTNTVNDDEPLKPIARPGDDNVVQPAASSLPANWLDYKISVQDSYMTPVGLTPADVDLQRLLRMSDVAYAYEVNNMPAGYKDLPQPQTGLNLPGDYSRYDPANNRRNEVIGNASYEAIYNARVVDLPPDVRFDDPTLRVGNQPPFTDTLAVAANRFNFYQNYGSRREPGRNTLSGALNRYGRPFDDSDELELRTFQGVNDPTRTSRLESVVAGRFQDDPNTYDLSPLRDNRPLSLEMAGRDVPSPDLTSTTPAANSEYRKALLAAQIDARHVITTRNGSRPIIDKVAVDINDAGAPVLSESAGTIRADGNRLVSRMVETGNFSFERNLGILNPATMVAGPCDPAWRSRVAPAKEDTWDMYGWFYDDTAVGRDWFYRALDNLPPPEPLADGRNKPPTGALPQAENYTESRLDLMREAFRAYLDCLLPYSQWGDPQRMVRDGRFDTSSLRGPFPDAWDPTNAQSRHLAYGYNPELAYLMAAHLAVNLRDALDTDRRSTRTAVQIQEDNQQTAVTLDLTPDAVIRTSGLGTWEPLSQNAPPTAAPAWSGYQRLRDYPWPRLNPVDRFAPSFAEASASARARMTPRPEWVRSTGHPGTQADKRINIFGIEAQPFITQVTAMALYADTPPSGLTPLADDEAGSQIQIPGQPPPPPPPITINVQRKIGNPLAGDPGNPDFICNVIAFQITNPFDTDIELEPDNPSETDSWYYLEYAKRYYRLVPQDHNERGGFTHGPASTTPPLNWPQRRILHAGESRVFYATYPNSSEDIARRINLVQKALARRFNTTEPTLDTTLFDLFAKHEFGEYAVHVAPMYPETSYAIGADSSGGSGAELSNVDLFSIGQPYSPDALPVPAGSLGEKAQPDIEPTDERFQDSRRVVNLWRVLRDPDTIDGDPNDGRDGRLLAINAGTGRSVGNWTGNDLLLDRLRDPAPTADAQYGSLLEALVKPFPSSSGSDQSNIDVPGTQAGPDEPGRNARENTGFSMVSWVSIVRPSNPLRPKDPADSLDTAGVDARGKSPDGAMPPWCMEAKPDNVYTPGFKQGSPSTRLWSLNRVRGLSGVGTGARYGDPINSYYKRLDDLVRKHMRTTYRDSSRAPYPAGEPPTNNDPKFVDPDLSVQFAERRGGKARPAMAGSDPPDPREQYSITDVDQYRVNGETPAFGPARKRRFDEVAVEIHRLPPDLTGDSESQANPGRALFSRVGDFLLPLAIGPWYDPSATPNPGVGNPTSEEAERDAKWTTLSEALAMSCDYYSGTQYLDAPQGSSGSKPNLYYKFAHDTRDQNVNPPDVPKSDRGQLVLDAWVPYIDYNANNIYNGPNPNQPSLEPIDAPLGNGIPLALNVMDKFRVSGLPAETHAKPSDPRLCRDNTNNGRAAVGNMFATTGRSTAAGSATELVPGKININLAPYRVKMLLPMLSPSPDLMDPTNTGLFDSWLYDGRFTDATNSLVTPLQLPPSLAGANPPTPRMAATRLWDPFNNTWDKWDIAATFEAYANKSVMMTRTFFGDPPVKVDFSDDRRNGQNTPGRDDATRIHADDLSQGGLRDAPGFKSVGEIMMADIRLSTDPEVVSRVTGEGYTGNAKPDTQNSISRLAHDGASNRSLGIESVGYGQDRVKKIFGAHPGSGGVPNVPSSTETFYANRIVPEGADDIVDDYDEKLSVANAILNSISVRSDVFCVWFVVNGYTPEDVQVDDGFPMVPSVARRYVMVVDRSNVDSPTTKPKIVMLREVPMQ